MSATPENLDNEKTPVILNKKSYSKELHLRPLLNRDLLVYLSTVATGMTLSASAAIGVYNLNYKFLGYFMTDLSILDQFRDLNTAVALLGGFVVSDIVYHQVKGNKFSGWR